MATLWGGRFTKNTHEEAFAFNASLSFDIRLLEVDIEGSLAHGRMLHSIGILNDKEYEDVKNALLSLLEDWRQGRWQPDMAQEDVHSLVESALVSRIGEAGKKLHTGRSRNDQVALDMRLYTKRRMEGTRDLLRDLLGVLLSLMEAHTRTYMPGFTHLQKAQPTTLSHHLGAYFSMFRRDWGRLGDALARMDVCPLGAGALAGTVYALDREMVAGDLGFGGITANSMDSVSDRDYLVECLSALSLVMMHLSRFCEELILWNSQEFAFAEMDDAYATGSSIMPQKKNPDVAELVRGKTGRVYGHLFSLLTVLKGLPLAYNKDMQEDKEAAFDAFDTADACLSLFGQMLSAARFDREKMAASAMGGYTNATDVADYLVERGMAFRDAHHVSGRLVLLAIERGLPLEALPLEDWQAHSPLFGEDIYKSISLESCVGRRNTAGGPGPEAMEAQLAQARAFLQEIGKGA